jgi:hypothetical protein
LPGKFAPNPFQHRLDRPAWPTPWRPEIDHNWERVLAQTLEEIISCFISHALLILEKLFGWLFIVQYDSNTTLDLPLLLRYTLRSKVTMILK